MANIFVLAHKPGFFTFERKQVVGVFEREQDAYDALKQQKVTLRKPYVEALQLTTAMEAERLGALGRQRNEFVDLGPDPIYRPDRGQYGSGFGRHHMRSRGSFFG